MRFIVTKHKLQKVKVVSLEEREKKLFGKMNGTGRTTGNIVKSIGEKWNADS